MGRQLQTLIGKSSVEDISRYISRLPQENIDRLDATLSKVERDAAATKIQAIQRGKQGRTKAAKVRKDTMAEVLPIKVVFVLGGPGVGKDTQCDKIAENCPGW